MRNTEKKTNILNEFRCFDNKKANRCIKNFVLFFYMKQDECKKSYQWKSQFGDKVHTLLVLYEDNTGEWMNNAIDRAHLKSKVFRQKWFCNKYFNENNI